MNIKLAPIVFITMLIGCSREPEESDGENFSEMTAPEASLSAEKITALQARLYAEIERTRALSDENEKLKLDLTKPAEQFKYDIDLLKNERIVLPGRITDYFYSSDMDCFEFPEEISKKFSINWEYLARRQLREKVNIEKPDAGALGKAYFSSLVFLPYEAPAPASVKAIRWASIGESDVSEFTPETLEGRVFYDGVSERGEGEIAAAPEAVPEFRTGYVCAAAPDKSLFVMALWKNEALKKISIDVSKIQVWLTDQKTGSSYLAPLPQLFVRSDRPNAVSVTNAFEDGAHHRYIVAHGPKDISCTTTYWLLRVENEVAVVVESNGGICGM